MSLSSELTERLEWALWNPLATTAQFEAFCIAARQTKGRAVCVPSGRVALASARLEDSGVKVVCLTGFPLGNSDSDVKRFEAEAAIDNGAQEIEVVLSMGRLRDGDSEGVLRELRDIVECADERPVCVAFETNWLTREETILACHLVLDSGATGISTSTGFWPQADMTAATVQLLRDATSPKFEIKAAPVTSEQVARALIEAGATRLGIIVDPARREDHAQFSPEGSSPGVSVP